MRLVVGRNFIERHDMQPELSFHCTVDVGGDPLLRGDHDLRQRGCWPVSLEQYFIPISSDDEQPPRFD